MVNRSTFNIYKLGYRELGTRDGLPTARTTRTTRTSCSQEQPCQEEDRQEDLEEEGDGEEIRQKESDAQEDQRGKGASGRERRSAGGQGRHGLRRRPPPRSIPAWRRRTRRPAPPVQSL